MTTFTTEDREHAFGATINVEPIPFAGWVNASPPHIVDSGASVMVRELTDDEIMRIAQEHGVIVDAGVYEFARAILRKAQEK
jgi:hypothetical protein